MIQTKKCNACSDTKAITYFSKCKRNTDSLQSKCKECNKKDNHKFRTELNPTHHHIWQKENAQKVHELVRKYRLADKSGKIYYIVNPDGEYYIGMTSTHLNVRWMEHRIHYRAACNNKRYSIPLLHKSFDKYGIENHRIETIIELDGISRNDLRAWEKVFIQSFREKGNVLNINN